MEKEGKVVPKNSMLISVGQNQTEQQTEAESKPMMLGNAPAPLIDTQKIVAETLTNKRYSKQLLQELNTLENV